MRWHGLVSTGSRPRKRSRAPRPPEPKLERLLIFARNFLKHPRMLGSFVPSSRFLIDRILDQIDFERARVIVEYGPGVGPFTKVLLERMQPDAHLVAIEMNEELAAYLRESASDPRLHIVNASAEDAAAELARLDLPAADYVISGIPFSTMPGPLRRRVVLATRDVLAPGGAFLVYQFSRAVLADLETTFDEVREEFEPRNIPPARLFFAA